MANTILDVAIIGAGIIGTSIARRLSRYQLNIAVVEKEADVSMGATKANSAIVHGGFAETNEKLKGRLCYHGRKQFAALDSELNFGFLQTGSLVFTTQEEDLPKLQALHENGVKNGLPDLEIINHDQALAIEPNLNPEVKYALYCKGAGICSPYEMAIAMAENAAANGVAFYLNAPVTAITEQDHVFTLTTPQGTYQARYVINCAGLCAAEISKMIAPTAFDIKPRTGEYVLFARGSGKVLNTVVFQMPTKMGKGILVTPTVHGNLLLGPDAIDQTDLADTSTHVERLARIYHSALHTTKKVNMNQFIRSFAGMRAVATGDDFIIEETQVKGFIQAAGIQSPGLAAAPAIADMIAQILADAGLDLIDDETYNPHRDPIISINKKMRPFKEVEPLVAQTEGGDRLVCRCEQVTEDEIRDCLGRGLPVTTLDAVKRRTRAGMGFCQGNFCGPRVKALMEEVLGHPVSDQTDVQMLGVHRVQKAEVLAYLADNPK